jgi:glycerol-3-phosphate dehydrogenase
VVARLGVGGDCVTRTLPLVGADGRGAVLAALPQRLSRRFGSDAAAVAASGPVEPVAAGLPALKCEVGWALAAEAAVTVEDVERRLRLDLVPAWRDAARGYLEEVVSHSVR